MQFISSCLIPDKDKENLRFMFQQIDQNFDYKLTRTEFVEGIQELKLAEDEHHANNIFKLVDFGQRDHQVKFSEFCTAFMDHNKILSQHMVKAAFKLLDVNGDGFVSFEELNLVMTRHGIAF